MNCATLRLFNPLAKSVVALAVLLTACSPSPPSLDSKPLRLIAEVDADTPFAGNDQGSCVAYVADKLLVRDIDHPKPVVLAERMPLRLAWNPAGTQLAAAFQEGHEQTRLVLFDREGHILREQSLPIVLQAVRWSVRGDLLAYGYRLQAYSFGSNLTQKLYVWTADGPLDLVLADTTLKPGTTERIAEDPSRLLAVTFSDQGDEMLFTRLHDPPEFAPYLELVYRNWQVPSEKILARIDPQEIQIRIDVERGVAKVQLADASVIAIPLWPGEGGELQASMPPGNISPAEHYRLVDGRLLEQGRLLAEWPPGARIQFLADGRFLVAVAERLYLGEGLQPEPRPVYRDRDWMLRRWLHQGLISPEEFRRVQTRGLP